MELDLSLKREGWEADLGWSCGEGAGLGGAKRQPRGGGCVALHSTGLQTLQGHSGEKEILRQRPVPGVRGGGQ